MASIRCRAANVNWVGVFISDPYKNWEDCAVLVISGVLTFLRLCVRVRAKIAIRTGVSKGSK